MSRHSLKVRAGSRAHAKPIETGAESQSDPIKGPATRPLRYAGGVAPKEDQLRNLAIAWFYSPCFRPTRNFITLIELIESGVFARRGVPKRTPRDTVLPEAGLDSWLRMWVVDEGRSSFPPIEDFQNGLITYHDFRLGLRTQNLRDFLLAVIRLTIQSEVPRVLKVDFHSYVTNNNGLIWGLPLSALLPTDAGKKIREQLPSLDGPLAVPWHFYSVFVRAFPDFTGQLFPVALGRNPVWFGAEEVSRLSPQTGIGSQDVPIEEMIRLCDFLARNRIKLFMDKLKLVPTFRFMMSALARFGYSRRIFRLGRSFWSPGRQFEEIYEQF